MSESAEDAVVGLGQLLSAVRSVRDSLAADGGDCTEIYANLLKLAQGLSEAYGERHDHCMHLLEERNKLQSTVARLKRAQDRLRRRKVLCDKLPRDGESPSSLSARINKELDDADADDAVEFNVLKRIGERCIEYSSLRDRARALQWSEEEEGDTGYGDGIWNEWLADAIFANMNCDDATNLPLLHTLRTWSSEARSMSIASDIVQSTFVSSVGTEVENTFESSRLESTVSDRIVFDVQTVARYEGDPGCMLFAFRTRHMGLVVSVQIALTVRSDEDGYPTEDINVSTDILGEDLEEQIVNAAENATSFSYVIRKVVWNAIEGHRIAYREIHWTSPEAVVPQSRSLRRM